jgi:RNA polymerase sigma factor (sigma-70 family)
MIYHVLKFNYLIIELKNKKLNMNKYEKLFKDITGHEFESYYNEHKPSLTWYIAKSYRVDMDRADEFANQAFMQSLEKIETYNKEKSLFKTWLTKIAINLVIKEWKDSHRYNFISLERDTTEAPSILNILHSDDDSNYHEQEEENKKKVEIVYDVINNLPDKYKKVMVMRELNHMAYKDIADSIKKEIKIDLNKEEMKLENPEDFFSLDLENEGLSDVIVNFISEDGQSCSITISPEEKNASITRDDIQWERGMNDMFVVDSTLTKTTGMYITTTNLSTVKSQIKKGRELIQKKVAKKFKIINENGVRIFSV